MEEIVIHNVNRKVVNLEHFENKGNFSSSDFQKKFFWIYIYNSIISKKIKYIFRIIPFFKIVFYFKSMNAPKAFFHYL